MAPRKITSSVSMARPALDITKKTETKSKRAPIRDVEEEPSAAAAKPPKTKSTKVTTKSVKDSKPDKEPAEPAPTKKATTKKSKPSEVAEPKEEVAKGSKAVETVDSKPVARKTSGTKRKAAAPSKSKRENVSAPLEDEEDKENVETQNPPKAERQTKKRRVETPAIADENSASVEPDTEAVSGARKPLDVLIGMTGEKDVKPVGVWMDEWKADTLVIVAYTKANTPGCIKQCEAFSNAELPSKTRVIGLSLDSDTAQSSFVEKKSLKFPLVHTGAEDLANATNCLSSTGKMVRSVVMVHRDGEIIYEKHKVSPEPCCMEALKFLNDREVTEDEVEEKRKPKKKVKAKN